MALPLNHFSFIFQTNKINKTGCTSILALCATIVYVDLTVLALETFDTVAPVGSQQVYAGRAVLTGVRAALIDIHLTVTTSVTCRALTSMRVSLVDAGTTISTHLKQSVSGNVTLVLTLTSTWTADLYLNSCLLQLTQVYSHYPCEKTLMEKVCVKLD